MTNVITRIVAFLLIAESLVGALRIAGLLSVLGIYDAVAVLLIFARGALGTLQFAGGWLLATHRPQGAPIARAALVGGALLTPLDVGFNLAPTDIYPWYRWQVTGIYVAYAAAGALFLGRERSNSPPPA